VKVNYYQLLVSGVWVSADGSKHKSDQKIENARTYHR